MNDHEWHTFIGDSLLLYLRTVVVQSFNRFYGENFMLSENRDMAAAKRFFKKALSSPHNQDPRVITLDKNPAYRPAIHAKKNLD
jgi:hypothetical protein